MHPCKAMQFRIYRSKTKLLTWKFVTSQRKPVSIRVRGCRGWQLAIEILTETLSHCPFWKCHRSNSQEVSVAIICFSLELGEESTRFYFSFLFVAWLVVPSLSSTFDSRDNIPSTSSLTQPLNIFSLSSFLFSFLLFPIFPLFPCPLPLAPPFYFSLPLLSHHCEKELSSKLFFLSLF